MYYLWYTPIQWRNGRWNGGLVEWREWSNGGNGGKGGMAEWQKKWQNGKMAEMDTYVLFMVHADTDNNTNDDKALIFYLLIALFDHMVKKYT